MELMRGEPYAVGPKIVKKGLVCLESGNGDSGGKSEVNVDLATSRASKMRDHGKVTFKLSDLMGKTLWGRIGCVASGVIEGKLRMMGLHGSMQTT